MPPSSASFASPPSPPAPPTSPLFLPPHSFDKTSKGVSTPTARFPRPQSLWRMPPCQQPRTATPRTGLEARYGHPLGRYLVGSRNDATEGAPEGAPGRKNIHTPQNLIPAPGCCQRAHPTLLASLDCRLTRCPRLFGDSLPPPLPPRPSRTKFAHRQRRSDLLFSASDLGLICDTDLATLITELATLITDLATQQLSRLATWPHRSTEPPTT